ncbi:unnamed protein product [Parajaminaea phylloscopi]
MDRCERVDDVKHHPLPQRAPGRAGPTGEPPQKAEQQRQRFHATLDDLATLLHSAEAAEELASSWHGADTTVPAGDHRNGEHRRMGLSDLKRLLDTGRRVGGASGRGIPAWIVVRTMKASWHHDGSWPLVGSDEDVSVAPGPAGSDAQQAAIAALPRSIHPSHLLLRPPGQMKAQGPPPTDPELEKGLPPQRPDPIPEDVARRYAARGIEVGPAPISTSFDED